MNLDVLTAEDAAAQLGCEPSTIEERARTGDLPALKLGRGWVFPRRALDDRLNEIAVEQAQARRAPTPSTGVCVGVPQRRTPPTLPGLDRA